MYNNFSTLYFAHCPEESLRLPQRSPLGCGRYINHSHVLPLRKNLYPKTKNFLPNIFITDRNFSLAGSFVCFLPIVLMISSCLPQQIPATVQPSSAAPATQAVVTASTTPSPEEKSMCVNPSTWQIQFGQSGGIAGTIYSFELSDDGSYTFKDEKVNRSHAGVLAASQLADFEQRLLAACPYLQPAKSDPKQPAATCPDCFSYSLNIRIDQNDYSFPILGEGAENPSKVQEFLNSINQLFNELKTLPRTWRPNSMRI